MKNLLTTLFLALSVNLLFAQSLTCIPDNGYQGDVLDVTILASGNIQGTQGTNSYAYVEFFGSQQGTQGSSFFIAGSNTFFQNVNSARTTLSLPSWAVGFLDMTFVTGVGGYYNENNAFYINPNLAGNNNISGTIFSGTPKNGTGNPVPYFNMMLKNANGDILARRQTDGNGNYSFLYLPDGTYFIYGDGIDNTNPPSFQLSAANGGSVTNADLVLRNNTLTGIESIAEQIKLRIAPIPFVEALSIQYTLKEAKELNITVYDINGRKLSSITRGTQSNGTHTHTIDANEYNMNNAGYYLIDIQSGAEHQTIKVLKQ